LDSIRHSCAHLLAAAVKQIWPHAKNAIGPSIETGFYQDFDMGDTKVSEDDFGKIEEKMRQLLASWNKFEIREVTVEEARKDFADNPYKLELIEEFGTQGKTITENNPGNFLDLCKGGHSDDLQNELQHFKLLSVAGAYWRGNEKNKMLTRIYGTCFSTKKELDDYIIMLEEAKKRDHKKLGKELGLFVFSETVGKGLPLWTPKGASIRRELERFIVDEELRRGYLHVMTPDIASIELYKKSGHYPYYKDSMYSPIVIDDEQYMLRPMSCPHHFELYLSDKHSYKELPIRYAELAKLYRYEQSGELMGLQRVRTFTLADAHIVCRRDQAKDEIHGVLDLIDYVCSTLGLTQGINYRYRLSLGDRADEKKYFKDDRSWDEAEDVLRSVLQKRGSSFFEAAQEAAFYGPKIDIQMKNVNGKEDTAFTVQYDFVMPKRFALSYINEHGESEEPVVVHRSSIGAIERVMAFLIEHYAGAWPVWLAPIQVAILPVSSEKHSEGAKNMANELKSAGVRVWVDEADETVGNKIRKAATQKIPYVLVVGDKELSGEDLMVRVRGKEQQEMIDKNSFIERVKKEIVQRIG